MQYFTWPEKAAFELGFDHGLADTLDTPTFDEHMPAGLLEAYLVGFDQGVAVLEGMIRDQC